MKKLISSKSIKSKLFISLSSLISATLVIIAIISFVITKHEAQEVFDSNLVRTGKLLLNLTKHEIVEHETKDNFIIDLGLGGDRGFHPYEYKIHFQIWKSEYLIYNSSADINIQKPRKEGFNNIFINKKHWKSFVIYDKESDVTVEVLEEKNIRSELVKNILLTLFSPLLISFIPILFIIWLVVNRSLAQLIILSRKIKNVSPLYLKPFENNEDYPSEVKPIINSLNFLLLKVEESMYKERKFINYASHELRTPLAVIKTKTQFLLKKYNNDNELQSDLKNLLLAVNRVINLSNQLLMLSRIDTENKLVKKEVINIGNLINKVKSNFKETAANKNIEIITQINDDYFICVNKFHIEIMLNNLFDNAIKYSPINEKIEILLFKKNNKISFSIKNKGNPISSEDQKYIFERFYRAKNNTEIGSGLGLSIVKKIIELHEAKITLKSTKQNTSFTVDFKSIKT